MSVERAARNVDRECAACFCEQGFEVVAEVLSDQTIQALGTELSALYQSDHEKSRTRIGGVRNLLRRSPGVAELASSSRLRGILRERLGRDAFPVRALFFD